MAALLIGLAAGGVGLGGSRGRYWDLVLELQGKCDYRPCVPPAELAAVKAWALLSVIGLIAVAVAIGLAGAPALARTMRHLHE